MTEQRTTSPRRQTLADLVSTIMVLCRGHLADGKPFWAYLALKPSDAHLFYEARQQGVLDLEEYGTVIEWGEGDEPPDEIKAQMQAQYGMRSDFEEQLLAALTLHGPSAPQS